MSREVLYSYLDPNEPTLEIGPLVDPFIAKDTHNVYYADVLDTEGVYNHYKDDKSLGLNESQNKIAPIDFVIKETYQKAVGDMRFASVFSSHVIEHVPDIIGFLIELSEILAEDGKIVMAIPDKRYTFDHFREVTPFRDAYDVFVNGKNNTARLAFDCVLNYHVCNEPVAYFFDDIESFCPVATDNDRSNMAKAIFDDVSAGRTQNVHYWVFTYESFLSFLRDGIRCKILPFTLEYSSPPEYFSNEFHIILKKDPEVLSSKEKWKSEIIKITNIIECDHNALEQKYEKDFINRHQTIYIYGAGQIGQGWFRMLQGLGISVSAFIISDGQAKPKNLYGIPVYYLSEILDKKNDCGIIVAMNYHNRAQVIPLLQDLGIEYI